MSRIEGQCMLRSSAHQPHAVLQAASQSLLLAASKHMLASAAPISVEPLWLCQCVASAALWGRCARHRDSNNGWAFSRLGQRVAMPSPLLDLKRCSYIHAMDDANRSLQLSTLPPCIAPLCTHATCSPYCAVLRAANSN